MGIDKLVQIDIHHPSRLVADALPKRVDVAHLLMRLRLPSQRDVLSVRREDLRKVVARIVVHEKEMLDALPPMVLDPLGQHVGLILEDALHHQKEALGARLFAQLGALRLQILRCLVRFQSYFQFDRSVAMRNLRRWWRERPCQHRC